MNLSMAINAENPIGEGAIASEWCIFVLGWLVCRIGNVCSLLSMRFEDPTPL